MSDHYTGQLQTEVTDVRVANSTGRSTTMGLLIRKYWLGSFKANDDVTVKFPKTRADFVEFVNRKEVAKQERKDYYRTKAPNESFEDWKARRDQDPEATLR
jgi:hypothetical protein